MEDGNHGNLLVLTSSIQTHHFGSLMNHPGDQQSYQPAMGVPVISTPSSPTGTGWRSIYPFLDDLAQMEQNLAQIYKDNLMLMTQSLEQYKNEMAIFQKKYNMLREDYLFNLRVINERDEELRKCDSQLSQMNGVCILERAYA